jgi:hypothetical protein
VPAVSFAERGGGRGLRRRWSVEAACVVWEPALRARSRVVGELASMFEIVGLARMG